MGAKKNLEKIKKEISDAWGLLQPGPKGDARKAETDLIALKTFIETSQKAFDTKAKTVMDYLVKLARGAGDGLEAVKKGDNAKATKEITDATTDAAQAVTAIKTAMS